MKVQWIKQKYMCFATKSGHLKYPEVSSMICYRVKIGTRTKSQISTERKHSSFISGILSCEGKICTIIQLPWDLATANGIEGHWLPVIGTLKGKIVIDQVDVEKVQKARNFQNLITESGTK